MNIQKEIEELKMNIQKEIEELKEELKEDLCFEDMEDCYCKQLKRKEQECEKYKRALDKIEKILDDGTTNTQCNNAKQVHAYYLARFCDIRDTINKAKEK